MQHRLIETLKRKLDNGEFTERGLARLSGISQPQVHNLLKGARRLHQESADTLLTALNLSVIDLLTESDLAGKDQPPGQPNTPSLTLEPSVSPQQLSLLLEPELVPRKNPASIHPHVFTPTERAS